ncbi:Hypothetical protein SMAX5B_022155 [Scophthalmus maximus]|uniref:Uncharacterized protein n=1 Tax=Scophthalmus maximus TaxID=52904 RepID=A0A2U9B7A2_SCOMX|nr:Hypothetical protein SMAX5B_022155 [Scophthalmus maximus]
MEKRKGKSGSQPGVSRPVFNTCHHPVVMTTSNFKMKRELPSDTMLFYQCDPTP